MFLIVLNYIKPITEVEKFVEDHRTFLMNYYSCGNFLLSGRKEPRNGGIIIATAKNRAEIEHIIQQDPFYQEKIADYEIIEFLPSMSANFLTDLITS